MSEPRLWIVEAPHSLDALQRFRESLSAVWLEHPEIPTSIQIEISIASAEIAANIVEHSGMTCSGKIRMEVAIYSEEVRVRFFDNGRELDIDLDSVRLPHELAERGRGLALARAVLSQLYYERCAQRYNCWTLISERFSA